MLESTSIKIANFKPFGKDPQGFDKVLPINIIVGKNNTGKSALLDLVQFMIQQFDLTFGSHKGKNPEVYLTRILSVEDIQKVFSTNRSAGVLPNGMNHFNYGAKWIGKPIEISLEYNQEGTRKHFVGIEPQFENEHIQNEFAQRLADIVTNPFQEKVLLKVQADRNISSEQENNDRKIEVKPNGEGATNIIQSFYNNRNLGRRDLIEGEFLSDLNNIFYPDSIFTRVIVQRLENGK